MLNSALPSAGNASRIAPGTLGASGTRSVGEEMSCREGLTGPECEDRLLRFSNRWFYEDLRQFIFGGAQRRSKQPTVPTAPVRSDWD